jgi:hypothetical protein
MARKSLVMDLFEVISEEEFQAETNSEGACDSNRKLSLPPEPGVPSEMIYCEFCKGYYYAEYHFGDREEVKS